MKIWIFARLLRTFVWLRSLHAKLFLVTGLVTSLLTIMVAFSIIRNFRRQIENYAKERAINTAQVVETEIQKRDPKFRDPRAIHAVLADLAGANTQEEDPIEEAIKEDVKDPSIFQIDVFKGLGGGQVELVATSRPEGDEPDYGRDIGSYMNTPDAQATAEMVTLNTGTRAWKVYLPIENPMHGSPYPVIGLVRTYCDLKHWETVWHKNLEETYRLLPFVLIGEFILLWIILGVLVKDPVKAVTQAMGRLEAGDPTARALIRRRDELGQIATRFNRMAAQLQRGHAERETLIEEIQNFNTTLQSRVDEALGELQDKNQELEQLVERNALLRDELSQQERLAVAGQLTAAFAHEVGTPLNLVNGHLQLLRAQTDLSDRTRERLDTIQAQIERVGDIVRKLLGHTRPPGIQKEVVELNALLGDLQRLWSPALASHHVVFESWIPESCRLHADRKQMEQLFINLVNNAVDAMPNGGNIRLEATLDANDMSATPRWQIALSDTGAGMPAEIIPKIFKPMFTTKPEGKGTGLGLAIAREILRAHGSEPKVESVVGQGTTFRFTLPGAPHPT